MWKIKDFKQLTAREFYEIAYLRTETFVVAQQRIYQEVDQKDPVAVHVFNEQEGRIMAYARVYLIADGQKVSFGRVVTSPAARGQGMGRKLMEYVMTAIRDNYPGKTIEIEAQTQVQGFYEKFGFRPVGQPFIFESTPHIKMVHEPLK